MSCPRCSGLLVPETVHDGALSEDLLRCVNGLPHRVHRLRAIGNSVVPQIAEWIGQQIMKAQA